MKLLCGNAHLAAKAKLAAVGKTRGCIHIDCCTVNQTCKALRGLCVFRDDCVGMVRRMCGNMGDCLVRARNGLDSKDIIQKFGVKIPFPRRRAGNQLLRGFVQPEFDKRNAETIAQQTGTKVVPINPLSYDWETEMLNVAKALTPMDPE